MFQPNDPDGFSTKSFTVNPTKNDTSPSAISSLVNTLPQKQIGLSQKNSGTPPLSTTSTVKNLYELTQLEKTQLVKKQQQQAKSNTDKDYYGANQLNN